MHVAKYVPIGYRPPSPEEIIARRIARDLKIPTAAAIEIAAPQMAALIDGPCWLVPVPASNGSIIANLQECVRETGIQVLKDVLEPVATAEST